MARESDRDRDRATRRSRDDDRARHGRESEERAGETRRRSRSPDSRKRKEQYLPDGDRAAEKRARVSVERWRGSGDYEEEEEVPTRKVEEGREKTRRAAAEGDERKVKEERRSREDDGEERRRSKDERRERKEKEKEKEERRPKQEKAVDKASDGRRERRREGSADERKERPREEERDARKGKEERRSKGDPTSTHERREKRSDENGASTGVSDGSREKEDRKRRRGFREEPKVAAKEELPSHGVHKGVLGLLAKASEGVKGGTRGESRDEILEDYEKGRRLEGDVSGGVTNGDGGGFGAKVVSPELPSKDLELVQSTSSASNYHVPLKVSSVTTTIENGLINRADEVHGNSSSTEGRMPMPVTSGSLLFALDRAKKALQKQKELAEKLKKIPALDKLSTSGADGNLQVGTSKGSQMVPPSLFNATSVNSMSNSSAVAMVAGAPSSDPSAAAGMPLTGIALEAVKRAQEVAARMGFRQDPQFGPLINMFPGAAPDPATIPQKPSKAPVLRLDAQGREVDEYGNVINLSKPTNLSTLKVNINKQKKEAFQILKPELDASVDSNPFFDPRMGINKTKLVRPKRMSFQFVEEGKWSRQAEITRFKNQFGEAQAKELKTKQAQLARAKAELDINPNLIEITERVVIKEKQKEQIPDTEWWDVVLLPSGQYCDVADEKLNMEKITIYVEHPLPIQPPVEPAPPPPQPLKLTKKETKKLRTQRRLARERDRQEMIKQGLIEPPKPKVKMSNLMKVLGAEATQDPTKLEMQIRNEAAEREQAHVDRNIARKLTPSERREKKEKKLFDDPNTLETIVTVYKVNSLAHPKTRFQVDVNAQENRLTGCAVLSDSMCTIVVEGGKKSNKRYRNLMLKRIDWAAVLENEDDGGDDRNAPANKCLLVWQGSVAKPNFNKFTVHQCRTEAAARKIFADAGVPHYWDLAANFSDEVM